jgi:DNA-binding NarL/FixJ family response regulator
LKGSVIYVICVSQRGKSGSREQIPVIAENHCLRISGRILIVEDFQPYRAFVTALLHRQCVLQELAEASQGLEAVEKARQLQPLLVLMDVGLPDLSGIEAARRIRDASPKSKIIFLTQEISPEVISEAVKLGASGYVFKSEAETSLLPALEAVLNGKRFFSR